MRVTAADGRNRTKQAVLEWYHRAMQPREIRFLFDYLSPYAYLAWTQIHALAERHRCTVEPVPVVLGALLTANASKGPAEIPAKRAYIIKDVARSAQTLGVPLVLPPSHPFNPLIALRATYAVSEPQPRRALIDALFAAAWGGNGGVGERDDVARAAKRAGLDGAAIVERAQSDDVRALLRASTDRAIREGIFGVPTMLVAGEMFWGLDSFGHFERFLRGEERLDPALFEQWQGLPASAVRKQ